MFLPKYWPRKTTRGNLIAAGNIGEREPRENLCLGEGYWVLGARKKGTVEEFQVKEKMLRKELMFIYSTVRIYSR